MNSIDSYSIRWPIMSSVTSNPTVVAPLANRPASLSTIRIEPPRGWFSLRLREIWNYRELLYFFVWRDVKVRYKQTAIGILWVVLQPLLTMLVATLFFGRLAKLPSQGLPYSVFCFAGVVPWTYFSTSLLSVTNVVVENQRVITKVYFPRLILPVSAALSGLVDFSIGFLVLFIYTLAYGIRPTFTTLVCSSAPAARHPHGSRRGSLAFRSQRFVPGRSLSDPFHHPVLDTGFARLLFQSACSAALPLALWPEPHGWRH